MLDWLKHDLKQANKHRNERPWIVAYSHIPLYCKGSECDTYPSKFKDFDDLFYEYGVDIFLGAHKHVYQMFKPMYNSNVMEDEKKTNLMHDNYVYPKATVHVIQGNGGNKNVEKKSLRKGLKSQMLQEFKGSGLGRLVVHNSTVAAIESYDSADGQKLGEYFIFRSGEFGKKHYGL